MNHLDEGTIHAWLDGALDASRAAEVQAHVNGCAACAALVAEARGLIAASSRILTALDDAPAGVIPKRAPAIVPLPARRRMRAAPWLSAIAASLLLVALWRTGSVDRESEYASLTESLRPRDSVPAVATTPSSETRAITVASPSMPKRAVPTIHNEAAAVGSVVGGRGAAGGGRGVANAPVASAPAAAPSAPEPVAQRLAAAEELQRRDLKDAKSALDESLSWRGCYRVRRVADQTRLEGAVVTGVAEARTESRTRAANRPQAQAGAAAPAPAPATAKAADFASASTGTGVTVILRVDADSIVTGQTAKLLTPDSSQVRLRALGRDSAQVRSIGYQAAIITRADRVSCP